MGRFYSLEDFLQKGVEDASGTNQGEATREGTNGSLEPFGSIAADAREGDGRDDGNSSGAGAADVEGDRHRNVSVASHPKKPAKRA